ncbi:MAG TPA: transposase [Candidatus Tectomicrobia bacterium]
MSTIRHNREESLAKTIYRKFSGDYAELARQLVADGLVAEISAATGRRLLAAPQLHPWRHHRWWSPKHPREAGCYATVSALLERYTRPRRDDERVLSLDEKTSRPPRPRLAPTRPAQSPNRPNQYEHASTRAGALHRLAAFETRSGRVSGQCEARTRQQAGRAFLEPVDQAIAEPLRTIHLVCDHVSTPHGQEVTRWFATPPRVVVHFTPVHGSWMHHVEPWCSMLQRQRLRMVDVASKEHWRMTLAPCIGEWHQQAHPFNWSTTSVAKVMAEAPARAA